MKKGDKTNSRCVTQSTTHLLNKSQDSSNLFGKNYLNASSLLNKSNASGEDGIVPVSR